MFVQTFLTFLRFSSINDEQELSLWLGLCKDLSMGKLGKRIQCFLINVSELVILRKS